MRRTILALPLAATLGAPLAATCAGPAFASDQPVTRSHGITILGTPALPPDFAHFPYVNPAAPKGGEVSLAGSGSFDGFNPLILRGTADGGVLAPWVILPGGSGSGSTIGHVWEKLLTASADEVATAYGHLAHVIERPADGLWAAFEIRPEARFSDGRPVTAEDVVWTFNTLLEKGRPTYRIQLGDVKSVEAQGERRVVFHFKSNQNRELPLLVGGLPVLPKHFFEGRDFARPLTDPPVGSGPYRITQFELGRSVVYERRPDWWAAAMPTGIGTNNFGRVRFEFFRDSTVAMEAFKAGKTDIRSENISKNWATAYDFPAVQSGLVLKQVFRHQLPTGMQGYAVNTRRPAFANPLVRQALNEMFDFEWTNRNLFYDAYTRTGSYFSNSELASSGVPEGAELALLEPYRQSLPPALFTQPFALPVTDGSGNMRDQLRRAIELLREAGWQIKDRKVVDPQGRPMAFTILLPDPSLERPTLPYVQNLQRLGIDAKVRTVDPAQYQRLTDEFDFDMVMLIFAQGDIPGTELRDYWSCAAKDAKGSTNLPGICEPAIDALIEQVITAKDRAALVPAARALDRVLLWRYFLAPNWHSGQFNVAVWDRFGRPDVPMREGVNFDLWWVDAAKAAATDAARRR
jgi:microcin C transport system substrate-binding protein